MILRILLPPLINFLLVSAYAQTPAQVRSKIVNNASPLKRADVISVKAALEDMIVRRYSQELSAIVSFDRFNVGARFELDIVDEKDLRRDLANQDNYTDLDLGYLDADTLFDRYANVDAGSVSPLAKYAIKSVIINVGLQKSMGEDIKKTVEDWLNTRVKEEFGALGKSQVQFIQNETSNPTLFDRVIQMQGLVGQLILALAILLGIILWRILGIGHSKASEAQSPSVNIESKAELTSPDGVSGGNVVAQDEQLAARDLALDNKIDNLSSQIRKLSPKILGQLDEVITQWSDLGENGLMQIACFAEISGSVIGSLPIPKDQKKNMGDVFSKMSKLPLDKRLELVNQTYWDLVATLNLGTDALHKPFSFLGNSASSTVNSVLLGNDIDIQTVVSLYMPETMRKNYISSLDKAKKIEILNTASKLSSISQEKLKNIETKIAPYFQEKTDETDVSLAMTLDKLIEGMTLLDSCELLPKVEGPMMTQYKLKTPHLAFFKEWTSATQEMLIKRATNDELIAYVRMTPEMSTKILDLVSPRAKQILEDDLSRPDNLSAADKEKYIQSLHNRLIDLVGSNVVSLDSALGQNASQDDSDKVKPIAA